MRKLLALGLFGFFVGAPVVFGQERVSIGDFLLSRGPATAPSMSLDYTLASEADFDSEAGGFSYQTIDLDIPFTAPRHLNNCHAFMLGMRYRSTWLDTDTLLDDLDLHDLRLKLRWMYRQPGSKWSWMGLLEPGLATDGENIDNDDFTLTAHLGVRYASSPRLAWIAGAICYHHSMETRVYPGLGFQWRPTDDLDIRLTGPSLKASWQPHDDWILHAIVETGGGTWNVNEGATDYNIRMRSYQAGIGVERRLTDKIWLGLWGGVTIANDLEIETASGSDVFEDDADSGWFVKLGIRKIVW